MLTPGRKFSAGTGYRYGFNGKELDIEDPIQYDYGFRILDPRLGRFKSVDPLTKKYSWYTPFQFAGNTPIAAADLDGKEPDIKFESGYSSLMIGNEGIDKNVYNQAFDRMSGSGGIAVGMANALGLGEIYTLYKLFTNKKSLAPKQGSPSNNPRTPSTDTKISKSDAIEIEVKSTGETRSGDIRVNAQQGIKRLDITTKRVKEYVPEPRNPGTGERQINFKKEGLPEGSEIVPGSKGLKRTPTLTEQQIIKDNTPLPKTNSNGNK